MPISQQTAAKIFDAHREIKVAQDLRKDIETALEKHEEPTTLDAFGRARLFELGVPTGTGGQRCFRVEPRLALTILIAHELEMQKQLVALNELAKMELETN